MMGILYMPKILKLLTKQTSFADHNIEAYEIIVGFLCQCRKEKNLDMYVMFNRKRKYLMRELL